MRLTLRTLLAYLDDILDPADAEELGSKVRESDFASGLVHRIRSVAGRLRLSAPPVEGRGLGADANSVAEYLDNTLPADRIPEFEKVCLESDMHLAEVASCHQVLTLVLGEPAHVDLNLRNRIHNLPVLPPSSPDAARSRAGGDQPATADASHRVEAPVPERPVSSPRQTRDSDWKGAPDAGAPVDAAPAEPVATTGAPDYMAAERRSRFPGWLAALVAGFLITAAVLVGVRGILGGSPGANDIAQAPTDQNLPAVPSPEPAEDNVADNSFVPVEAPPSGAVSDNAAPRESEFVEPASGEMPLAPPLAATETPAESAVESPPTSQVPPSAQAELAAAQLDTPGPPAEALAAAETPPADAMGAATDVEAAPVATVEPLEGDAAAGDEPRDNWPAEQPKDLGRFASEDQLLAVWSEGQQAWQRLPARAALVDGVHLRVPTLFRPNLMLGSGIHVTLNDRTDVRLEAADDGNTRIVFGFGQALCSTIGDTQAVALQLGDQPVTVTFGDAQSQFALELQKQRLPGDDPFQAASSIEQTRIWPTSGNIGIQMGDGPVQSVAFGNVWLLTGGAAVINEVAAQPAWVTVPKRREIDRQAVARLASTIKPERSLTLELFEVVEHSKRNELRSLAARALASLGQFDPLIESFSDKPQHYAWNAHYDELLAGLARDPQSAERIREAANKYWGVSADRLLRMVIGYDPDRLRNAGAAELVAALSDEQLETRVIAIETLRRITGKSQLFFPEKATVRRREPTRKWQHLLESGEIVYRQWPPGAAATSP